MSKAVVFSDIHIHDYRQFNTDGNRLKNCIKVLFDIGEFCKQYDIKIILFSGDLYDTQKALLTEVVNETVDAFVKFSELYPDIVIYAISGNHDHSTKNLIGKEAVSALKHIHSIVPHTFRLIDDQTVEILDGVYLHGIPYYEYPEHFDIKLSEAHLIVNEMPDAEFKYLMIHQTPKGLGNAMIPYDCNPVDDRFAGYSHVFCGHIHARQNLASNFTLVGSPIHRDLGDAGQKKGFLVMNLLKPEKGYVFRYLADYPEFVERFEDEVTEQDLVSGDFISTKPRIDAVQLAEVAQVENFNTSLKDAELLKNYWKEVDGKDEELLKVGLNFLT